MLQLKILPAGYGDALLLQWQANNKGYNILIDGGINKIYHNILVPELEALKAKNESLNLVINTHIDFDHITGILELAKAIEKAEFSEDRVKRWWFNSGKLISQFFNLPPFKGEQIELEPDEEDDDGQISLRQGVSLEGLLEGFGKWHNYLITNELPPVKIGGATITLLSPDKKALEKLGENWEEHAKEERSGQTRLLLDDYDKGIEDLAKRKYRKDYSCFNRSSIAFLFEYQEKSILFLGDAVPEICIPAIKKLLAKRKLAKLKVDYVKLSHHGSKRSFKPELLNYIDSQNFIISTDASRYRLPTKTTLSKILMYEGRDFSKPIHFYFNYQNPTIKKIFEKERTEGSIDKFNFECFYPEKEEKPGYLLKLIE